MTACAVALSLGATAFASAPAADNASSYAYNPGNWPNGSNGGFGFAPWVLSVSVGGAGGHFIWKSTANADGLDDGIVGGVAGDGDIDTTIGPSPDVPTWPPANVTVPRSWGMWNAGGVTDAIRPFTGGPLAIGQTFSVDFDNGWVNTGQTVGIGLQNAAGLNLWEVYFVGGGNVYVNNDAAGPVNTTVGYGDEGLHVDFTLTGPAAYTMTLTRRDGVNQTIAGGLMNPQGDQNIVQFRAFNSGGPGGDPYNFYVNSLQIIPEPSTFGLVSLGLLGALALRRRK